MPLRSVIAGANNSTFFSGPSSRSPNRRFVHLLVGFDIHLIQSRLHCDNFRGCDHRRCAASEGLGSRVSGISPPKELLGARPSRPQKKTAGLQRSREFLSYWERHRWT